MTASTCQRDLRGLHVDVRPAFLHNPQHMLTWLLWQSLNVKLYADFCSSHDAQLPLPLSTQILNLAEVS